MKKLLKKKYGLYSLLVLSGFILGWLVFHSPSGAEDKHKHISVEENETIWTCSMHPQIRLEKPGKCPICGMDLIPLIQKKSTIDTNAIQLTKEGAQLANVSTSVVSSQKPIKQIRLYGKVQADERLLQSQVSHIPGRIEKLLVNFTGEAVHRGQVIALVYSPELVLAQQELLEAFKIKNSQPGIYEAAKSRLKQWMLTDDQVNGIENSGVVKNDFEVISNTSGIVTARRVNVGDYINEGTVLFDIADLSKIWVMFEAYESDLPFLKKDDQMNFTLQAVPGTTFSGRIIFIDPVVDPFTRISKVRVEVNNSSFKLKPEMFSTGIVDANLTEFSKNLIIPGSAVLWTGTRSIVYVKQPDTDEPVFKLREIELGPRLGDNFIVMNGLREGEEIVTQGTFSVDAAAQLEGKLSMMNISDDSADKMQMNSGNENEDPIEKAEFRVSGNCDLCKDRIEKAAKSVKGVISANWDEKTKLIYLQYKVVETNKIAIQKVIAKVGHDTDKIKANDQVYNDLPECCKYTRN